jgi:inosine/xanthosine triphosphate pyrophosphatase family protein
MPDLLIATHNQGKVQEYREMLGDALGAFRVVRLHDVGLGAIRLCDCPAPPRQRAHRDD